jgi:hypothetical protein
VVSCRKPQPSGAGQGAPGGKTNEPKPTHSQQQSTPLFILPVKVK